MPIIFIINMTYEQISVRNMKTSRLYIETKKKCLYEDINRESTTFILENAVNFLIQKEK